MHSINSERPSLLRHLHRFLWLAAALHILAVAPAAADTFLRALANPCSGSGTCTTTLEWRVDPHTDPSLTKVQMWRDDDSLVRKLSSADWCSDADGSLNSHQITLPVPSAGRTYRLYYASQCDAGNDSAQYADLRQEAARVTVFGVDPGDSLVATEDEPCLLRGNDSTCVTTLRWLSTDSAHDCVEVWRTSARNGQFKRLRCSATGEAGSKTAWINGEDSYALYPLALNGAAGCDDVSICTLGNSPTLPATAPLATAKVKAQERIRGVAFQAFDKDWLAALSPDDCPSGSNTAGCETDFGVLEELRELSAYTGLPHIKLELSAIRRVDWPVVSDDQVNGVARFLSDAHDNGLKVIINLGTQCWVPNSKERPAGFKRLAADHFRGDHLNNKRFDWSIPFCPDDNHTLATQWYTHFFDRLAQVLDSEYGLTAEATVAALAMDGSPSQALTSEIRLRADDDYNEDVKAYLAAVVPAVRNHVRDGSLAHPLGFPVGLQMRYFELGDAPDEERWLFFEELLDAMSLRDLDYIAMSSFPEVVDPTTDEPLLALMRILGRAGASKLVLSDFINLEAADETQNIIDHVDRVNEFNFMGWWYWTYRTYFRDPPLNQDRLWAGLRELVDFGVYDDDGDPNTTSADASELCALWDEDLVAPLRADAGAPLPSQCFP